ncbi:MAG: hypothetical protein GTN78_04235, partial [Gemmatimonadales bacterium]|nr:hypothetical protein [Gemmatimonadales bacterium]
MAALMAALVCGSASAIIMTERVSVSSAEAEADRQSEIGSVSSDGRYVAFDSRANNLVADDTNADYDIFVRDRWTGTTERVSLTNTGTEAD